MPNQPKPTTGTRGHYISSIPDDLWTQARVRAIEKNETLSTVVIRALREYVK